MKFIIATNNAKKLKELSAILEKLGIEAVSLRDAGITSDVEETGTTFEENAYLKANAAMRASGLPAIADDSGLAVDALDGAPGVYSARYGGEACTDDTERYRFLLENMRGISENARTARFVSVIACVFPDGSSLSARGECEGRILNAPRGEGGFGYDPVFYIESEQATMAELEPLRKNKISHRARALEIMTAKLEERI